MDSKRLSRRQMLATMPGLAILPALANATEMPEVAHPRATSGDSSVEPDWDKRLTVTVGREKADLCGNSEKVIQAAVDYVVRLGGGTVEIMPGEYRLRNSIFLDAGVRLLGNGLDTVLVKEPSVKTRLAANSDWYDREITLVDSSGFQLGDGVCLHLDGKDVLKRTLVAQTGNRFKLDKPLRKNFWLEKSPTVETLFPLLTAEYKSDFVIENLTLDGNRTNNRNMNGNYGGGIWVQDCSHIAVRGITVRNYNGDGLSWQICHDVVVKDCHVHDNAGNGLHPGSGSQRPLMQGNRLERNAIGLFFCWGVTYGLAEENTIEDSLKTGISIGHRDNDNVIRNNKVTGSGGAGISFREQNAHFTPSGNRLESNQVVDNGSEDDAAVELRGVAEGNHLLQNTIRETRAPASRAGIRIGPKVGDNEILDNLIEGFNTDISDLRNG